MDRTFPDESYITPLLQAIPAPRMPPPIALRRSRRADMFDGSPAARARVLAVARRLDFGTATVQRQTRMEQTFRELVQAVQNMGVESESETTDDV